MTWLLLGLLAAPCTQPPEPDCLAVPVDQAEVALRCVAADLPECQEQARLDLALCRVDADEAGALRTAAEARGDALARQLDRLGGAALPPPVPWYERPAVVLVVGVALGVGVAAVLR